jgi:hypothetical protein
VHRECVCVCARAHCSWLVKTGDLDTSCTLSAPGSFCTVCVIEWWTVQCMKLCSYWFINMVNKFSRLKSSRCILRSVFMLGTTPKVKIWGLIAVLRTVVFLIMTPCKLFHRVICRKMRSVYWKSCVGNRWLMPVDSGQSCIRYDMLIHSACVWRSSPPAVFCVPA